MKEVRSEKSPFTLPSPTILDRLISRYAPIRAAKRKNARLFMAMSDAYYGGSKKRRALVEWSVPSGDANADILPQIETLRERSRDLLRNNPIATGAIKTKVTNVVGTGLKLKSRIDRKILNLDEDAADEWERKTEAEFNLFAENTGCDVEDTLKFSQIQELAFRSVLENGDVFILTPMKESAWKTYALQLQLIEADRVCNADNAPDTEFLSGGVEKSQYGGAPIRYHITRGHPGNIYSKKNEWKKINARGEKTGRKNILHLFHKIRIGQSRGVPDLAPVIEVLKQLGRYTEAEIDAAVISAFFTVFVKTDFQPTESLLKAFGPMQPKKDIGGKTSDEDLKMASGAIIDLAKGEEAQFANPTRPNQVFEQFVHAMVEQIGVALELPYEVLIKHFTASYSAARAALLEAWKFFMGRRKWLTDVLCRPVYELWMTEAVAMGRIVAPGFLNGDPLVRAAWLGSEWIGPAKGMINEKDEVEAAKERTDAGFSTLDEETIALTGGDWEKNHAQRAKEVRMRKEDGLIVENKGLGNETMVQDNG